MLVGNDVDVGVLDTSVRNNDDDVATGEERSEEAKKRRSTSKTGYREHASAFRIVHGRGGPIETVGVDAFDALDDHAPGECGRKQIGESDRDDPSGRCEPDMKKSTASDRPDEGQRDSARDERAPPKASTHGGRGISHQKASPMPSEIA